MADVLPSIRGGSLTYGGTALFYVVYLRRLKLIHPYAAAIKHGFGLDSRIFMMFLCVTCDFTTCARRMFLYFSLLVCGSGGGDRFRTELRRIGAEHSIRFV